MTKKQKPGQMALPSQVTELLIHAIGHELKQPLGLIRAYSYYIKRNLPQEQAHLLQYPEKIDLQVDTISDMLNSIVDATKISLGSFTVSKQSTSLTNIINQLHSELAEQHPFRNFLVSVPDTEVSIHADEARLLQAFHALAKNAIQYSPVDTIITITVEVTEQRAKITFEDQGIGIASKDRSRVFEAFQRTAQAKKLGVKGLGVGLTIADAIIKEHNGTLTLKSNTSGGTTAIIELPLGF